MPEDRVGFLRRSYEAFNQAAEAGDMAAGASWMQEYLDPEIEWRLEEGALDTEVFRGYDGIAKLFDTWLEAWDEWSLEPEEFYGEGDVIVVADRIHGRGRGSGVTVEVPYAHVFRFRGERVVQIQDYASKEDALEAAGLSE